MQHTKEPWVEIETECDVIGSQTTNETGWLFQLRRCRPGFNGQVGIEQEANARRIVACVNACEGIPTGVLEKQGMVPIEQVTHDIEQQRDKLPAALTEIAELDILKYHHAYAIAKGAIAEVKGQS